LGVSQKILEIKCPKCQDLLRIRVDQSMLAEAKSLPVSVSYIHGDPIHSTTIWFDGNFSVRAIEAPDNTMIDHHISVGGVQHPSPIGDAEVTPPSEAALTDEALSKLEKALETIGRMNAEIVLELTRAHDELTNISEARKRRERIAADAARKRLAVEKPKEIVKAVRPEQAKERVEKRSPGKSKLRM
jgi:hypothetical protein